MDNLLSLGWPVLVLAVWFGLCVGSFLNVVIYRLPVMMQRDWARQAREVLEMPAEPPGDRFNLVVPRSRCPGCGTTISALQNVPVISWLALRGRCRHCGASISVRYPAVESIAALATVMVIALFGYTGLGAAVCLFTWVLIALTFIDFDTQLLPDQLTLPLLWLGLIVNLTGNGFVPLADAVAGAIAGYLTLWSIFWVFKLLTGREGMGYGDFKLLAAAGAWSGWQILPATVLVASVAGLVWSLITFLTKQRSSGQPIAFGPFLAVGAWLGVLYRDALLGLYL